MRKTCLRRISRVRTKRRRKRTSMRGIEPCRRRNGGSARCVSHFHCFENAPPSRSHTLPPLDCARARRKSHRSGSCTPESDVQPRSDVFATEEVAGNPKAQTPRLPGCRRQRRNRRSHRGGFGDDRRQEAQSATTYGHEYLCDRESYQGRRSEAGACCFLWTLPPSCSWGQSHM